jgi:hypothetical protein
MAAKWQRWRRIIVRPALARCRVRGDGTSICRRRRSAGTGSGARRSTCRARPASYPSIRQLVCCPAIRPRVAQPAQDGAQAVRPTRRALRHPESARQPRRGRERSSQLLQRICEIRVDLISPACRVLSRQRPEDAERFESFREIAGHIRCAATAKWAAVQITLRDGRLAAVLEPADSSANQRVGRGEGGDAVSEKVVTDPNRLAHRLLTDRLVRWLLAQVQQRRDPDASSVVAAGPIRDPTQVSVATKTRLDLTLQIGQELTRGRRERDFLRLESADNADSGRRRRLISAKSSDVNVWSRRLSIVSIVSRCDGCNSPYSGDPSLRDIRRDRGGADPASAEQRLRKCVGESRHETLASSDIMRDQLLKDVRLHRERDRQERAFQVLGLVALAIDRRLLAAIRRADKMQVGFAVVVTTNQVVDERRFGDENGDCSMPSGSPPVRWTRFL